MRLGFEGDDKVVPALSMINRLRRIRPERVSRFVGLWRYSALAGLLSLAAAEGETVETGEIVEGTGASAWAFEIVPYLWLAGYDGTIGPTGLPSGTPQVHTEANDGYLTHLSAAAMLTARVRYHDFGAMFDGAWVRLTTEGGSSSSLYSGTELKTDIAFTTFALSYRLPKTAPFQVDVFAGARVWFVLNDLELKPGLASGLTADTSQNWVDPILGAQIRYDFSQHWYGIILGDAGGFGIGSDITWSIFGGAGYQFTDWFSLIAGYRYLHVNYDQNQFLMNVNVQGFLVGLGFRF